LSQLKERGWTTSKQVRALRKTALLHKGKIWRFGTWT